MKKAGLQVPGFPWIVVLVSVLASVGLLRSVVGHWKKLDIVRERREKLEEATKNHQTLTEKLKEATSPAFIEREAREKLGLAREGDTIILMEKPDPARVGQLPKDRGQMTTWKRWWGLFF